MPVSVITSGTLVPGTPCKLRAAVPVSVRSRYADSSGTYVGSWEDEGELYHYFAHGTIGDTLQQLWGLPARLVVASDGSQGVVLSELEKLRRLVRIYGEDSIAHTYGQNGDGPCARCGNGPSAAYGDDVQPGHVDILCLPCIAQRTVSSVETDVTCPGCEQLLTVTQDGSILAVECGGEGEGSCDEMLEGSTRTDEADTRARARAAVLLAI